MKSTVLSTINVGLHAKKPLIGQTRDVNNFRVYKQSISNANAQHVIKTDDAVQNVWNRMTQGLKAVAVSACVASWMLVAPMGAIADDEVKSLCDAACDTELASKEKVKTASGLEFQDIVVGNGPAPPVGYQVVVHYILKTPDGREISNSLENGKPYDIRFGAGQVVAGLDEGLKTMRVGGVRRLYVPAELSFPKGLPAAAGRPRVPPASPIVIDVQLLYIPGLDMDE